MPKRRGILKWIGFTLCVLLLGVWIASLWMWASLKWGGLTMRLEHSTIQWYVLSPANVVPTAPAALGYFDMSGGWYDDGPMAGFPIATPGQLYVSPWGLTPQTSSAVSLRIPFVIVAMLTGILFRRDRRPTKPGCCLSCGYNLTGTQHEKCPECGAAAEWRYLKPDRRGLQRVLKWTGLAACVLLVAAWVYSWLWPYEGPTWLLHKGCFAHSDRAYDFFSMGEWAGSGVLLWLPLLGIGWPTLMLWHLERTQPEHLSRAGGRLRWLGLWACIFVAGLWLATSTHELTLRLGGASDLSYSISRGTLHRFTPDPRGVPIGLSVASLSTWRVAPSNWWLEAGWTRLDVYYVYTPLWLPLVLIAVPTIVVPRLTKRHPPGHCRWCGYDLEGVEHEQCPACGAACEACEVES